jgi:hypothetical protein
MGWGDAPPFLSERQSGRNWVATNITVQVYRKSEGFRTSGGANGSRGLAYSDHHLACGETSIAHKNWLAVYGVSKRGVE